MSPAARKFERSLNLPTIASGLMAVEHIATPDFHIENNGASPMTVAHSAKVSVNLLKDWMEFTHILGNGILSKIS